MKLISELCGMGYKISHLLWRSEAWFCLLNFDLSWLKAFTHCRCLHANFNDCFLCKDILTQMLPDGVQGVCSLFRFVSLLFWCWCFIVDFNTLELADNITPATVFQYDQDIGCFSYIEIWSCFCVSNSLVCESVFPWNLLDIRWDFVWILKGSTMRFLESNCTKGYLPIWQQNFVWKVNDH